MVDTGNTAQVRRVAEQVADAAADAAIIRFAEKHPEVRRGTVVAEIPAPLKWAAIIASAVLTVSASAGVIWLVTSVSEMNVTLARMDERMARYIDTSDVTDARQDREIRELQAFHRGGGR